MGLGSGRGSSRTKMKPRPIPPQTLATLATLGSPADQPRPPTELPGPPTKAAPEARRLDMDDALELTQEPTAEPGRKRHYDKDEDLEDLAPSDKRIRISPTASPVPPELLELAPPLESYKAKVCRAVSFVSKDQEMPDKEPESGKDPCESNGKYATLEFEEDDAIQDAEFAFLHCDENLAEPLTQPEPVVKTEGGCSRLIDSAKKFANDEKTPLKSSSCFNSGTTALLRSASQSLAGMLATPPTTNKDPVDKKTPSSKGKGMCYRMSQADVFGEDSSSDSDDENK